jgi:periplasmic divalent cation tolerance protein
MPLLAVWINCPDTATARTIAEALVAERLAACANIHAEIESVYRWKGAIERAREVPLLVKTRAEHFDRLAARVRALHPYETPAIVAQELDRVTDDYRAWLLAETGNG